MAGRRYFLVSYLPTACATLFITVLIWAGARGWAKPRHHRLRLRDAWATGAHLGAAELAGLTLLIAILSFLTFPLQTLLLRTLESQRPHFLRSRQVGKRKDRKAKSQAIETDGLAGEPGREVVQKAGREGYELRRRFPLGARDDELKALAFGNILAAAADQAGRPYGMDTAVTWPRLYPVLSEPTRAVVDDRRDSMDASARMTVVMAATAAVAAFLLVRTGWGLVLALIPAGLASLAYVAAVQAALAYGEAVRVAFDLHRFDLLKALRIELPEGTTAERGTFRELSDLWRQGKPLTITKYATDKKE